MKRSDMIASGLSTAFSVYLVIQWIYLALFSHGPRTDHWLIVVGFACVLDAISDLDRNRRRR